MTKDYFTALEAADYACVPLADFDAQADACGVLSFQYMGQRVYRKADLQASVERAWRLSTGGAVALPRGVRGAGKAYKVSAGLLPRPKPGRCIVKDWAAMLPKPKPMGWSVY